MIFLMNAFQNAKTKVMRLLYEKYLVNDTVSGSGSALRKVCRDNKFAYMTTDRDIERANADSNCTIQLLDVAWTRHIALLISKKNPFREAMNRLSV